MRRNRNNRWRWLSLCLVGLPLAACAPRSVQPTAATQPVTQPAGEASVQPAGKASVQPVSPTVEPPTPIPTEASAMATDQPTEVTQPPAATAAPSLSENPAEGPQPGGAGLTLQEHIKNIPPPPQGLTVSAQGSGLLLTWGPPAPVSQPHNYTDQPAYYLVYRSEDGGLKFVQVAKTTDPSYLDADVVSGKTYTYTVQAVDPRPTGGEVPGDRANYVPGVAP